MIAPRGRRQLDAQPMRRLAALALLCLWPALPALAASPAKAATPAASAPPVAVAASVAPPADWARTLERIAGSVVTIELDQTRSFDTERNVTAQATGFVVDAERGLILTNRHVVTPGPVVAEATFLNREEVELRAVYRDPVHDFGIYRYDPARLRFMKPAALPLAPEAAQIGREIRVVGNDAGEQLSILAGTIARLDREAPDYGVGRYNDFNTFYIQAASSTSGGSSGSPVIDVQGRVVALNAGGSTGSATSFYLPLGRVQRALRLIQQGKPVPRGTIETEFRYRPYDELRRLGLRTETEAAARAAQPANTGMLVVERVQPGSASAKVLNPGDVLVRVNHQLLTGFEPLEAVLDDAVGKRVELELERGGRPFDVQLEVGDLHAITPASYLEFGDAVVHTLSYQEARHFHLPISGVFVASGGYSLDAAGVPRGAVITELNSRPVATLADFEAGIAALGDGARFTVRYLTLDDPNHAELRSVHMDRRWFPARHCDRNDATGYWDCKDLPVPPPAAEPARDGLASPALSGSSAERLLAPSLVSMTFDMPYPISGVNERNYHGTGLIVDAERGLVITDRNTVPVSIGDVRLTFAGTVEIPAKVVYIHPLHNLAVVQYDPALVRGSAVRAAKLDLRPLRAGEAVDVVGLDVNGELKSRSTAIAEVDPLQLPLSRSVAFRDSNIDVATLVNPPDEVVGVLADRSGRVRGLWASFASDNGRELVQQNRGVNADLVAETLDLARRGAPLHSLEAEFVTQTLAVAHGLGLSEAWMKRIQQSDPSRRQVLGITRLVGGSSAAQLLQPGDLLLAVDGQVVTGFRDVERAVATRDAVQVTIWRTDGEHTFTVRTASLSGQDIDRVVLWEGATLQASHRALSVQRGIEPSGVYVAYFSYGSPASRYGLIPGRRIVEVDGQPTPDLDSFLKLATGRPDRASLRIKTLAINGAPEMITLKLDRHYWPAYELLRHGDQWDRVQLE
ncbi:MAG: trypsin-like peptidase domain-containing protein [Proteobacteria bacterium]|nr:trypsin-like peptidase domain-containing protein [Pseudomonadota bacterium]